jgi:hypothetical protein
MLYKLDLADLVKKTVEKDKNRGWWFVNRVIRPYR